MLSKLIAKQKELGLNDKEFAERLGVPRTTWQLTRQGVRPIRGRVARAAMRAFPEFTADALSFLLGDATRDASIDTAIALAS